MGNSPLWALDGSFTFQGGVAQALPHAGQDLAAEFGFNGRVALDIDLAPSLALGIGTGLTAFAKGNQRLYVDGTRLFARWSPFAASDWNPYLTAGAGFRPFYELDPNHRWWPGNFESTAGIGVRHPLVSGIDLDLTAFYDLNSPLNNALSSIGARGGLAFPFGGDSAAPEKASAPAPSPAVPQAAPAGREQAAAPVPGTAPQASAEVPEGPSPADIGRQGGVYACGPEETADSISRKLWGDDRYSDVLMDANPGAFRHGTAKAGARLRVPPFSKLIWLQPEQKEN
ncbi:MAG TPA: hypothetical protein VHE12_07565 [bacterium]|nr:hypothetical protein [bacterium]